MAHSRQTSSPAYHLSRLLLALWLGFVAQVATAEPDSMASVFNAFIATFAKEQVEWRKDIETIDGPDHVPPGKQMGVSKLIGYFAFSPRSWDDFTSEERVSIIRHPKFKSYVISLRNATLYPSIGLNEQTEPPRNAPGRNPERASFPVDGMPVRRTVAAKSDEAPTAMGPREIIELKVTPEQLLQKGNLRVELY